MHPVLRSPGQNATLAVARHVAHFSQAVAFLDRLFVTHLFSNSMPTPLGLKPTGVFQQSEHTPYTGNKTSMPIRITPSRTKPA
jgi:hypothetical protein